MNYSTAVMLINQNIRAVKTIYEHEDNKNQPKVLYKTLDQSIAEGDFVIVPTATRHGLTVVKVVEVDAEVDFESSTEVKWVIGKVDTAENERILAEESKWIDTLKASEKRRKREEIKKNMLDMYDDVGIDKLAIANMTGVTEIAHVGDDTGEE